MPHRVSRRVVRAFYLTLVVLFGCLLPTGGHAAGGVWKEKTQVVWSKEAGTLIRKNFRVWDPHPELDLDFVWEPGATASVDDTNGIANGPGTLTWHVKGAPNYDRQFIHSVFKGVLRNGRPEGQGALVVRNGPSYTGEWADGAMHGRGVLRLENGDRYDGDFVAGKMQGVGKYTATDGSVYFGEFRDGLRDGVGRLMLIDGAYRTVWQNGRELARQEITDSGSAGAAARLRHAAAANGVRVKLSLDQRKFIEFENADPDTETHSYEAENGPGTMTIRLASRDILNAWKGNGALASGREDGTRHILDIWQFPPVFLKVEVENGGGRPAQITSAFLDVFQSATDLTPYLELFPESSACCGTIYDYNPVFFFDNFGWGQVRDAQIAYSLGTKAKRTDETVVRLGTFDGSKKVSIVDRLRQLGVNVDRLRRASMQAEGGPGVSNRNRFTCGYEEEELAVCFERLKNSGVFGRLKDFVFRQENDSVVRTTIVGRIEYRWLGRDGKSNPRVSRYTHSIPLAKFNVDAAEEGEPAPTERSSFKAVPLSLDRRNYKIALPRDWNVRLGETETKTLDLTVSATRSSQHRFQLVLQLADNTQVKSPIVDLSYFWPRVAVKWKPPQ